MTAGAPMRSAATPLAIVGAGGHAIVVADLVRALPAVHTLVGFIDDDRDGPLGTAEVEGIPVIGALSTLTEDDVEDMLVFPGAGSTSARARIVAQLDSLRARMPSLVHPAAVVSEGATVRDGALVCAGAVVSVGADVGRGAIVNTRAVVDHHCTVSDFVHVGPGATLAGRVVCAEGAWIGLGAAVIEHLRLGDHCVVGAGAAVVRDVEAGTTVVGVPARPISRGTP